MYKNYTATISCSLSIPQTQQKTDVVLIIAGSGPTDRDGNNPQGMVPYSYKYLAELFFNNNISCLRYDKRWIGKSLATNDPATMLFNDYVNDAANLVQYLRDSNQFNRIFVAGHSEGSLIGIIANQQQSYDGYISLAGAGFNAGEILETQLKPQLDAQTFKQVQDLINDLLQGKTGPCPQGLENLFRPEIQPYLISWFAYYPQEEMKKLLAKTLIIQGNTDIQINVQDAYNLHIAQPSADLKIINGMNHILKNAPINRELNIQTYYDPNLPLNHDLTKQLLNFIHSF